MGILSSQTIPATGASVTVPSGATIAAIFWTYYNAGAGNGLASASIGGQSFTIRDETNTAAADRSACGVATAVVSGSGSQTFNITYDAATTAGPVGFLVFFDDAFNTADFFRAADSNAQEGGAAVSASCSMQARDTVIGMDARDTSSGGTTPADESGWTTQLTHSNNFEAAKLRTLNAPSAGTATLNSQATLFYSTASILSLKVDRIEVRGAGAQSVSTTSGGTLSPAYPTGYTAVADDICVLIAAGLHNTGSSLAPSDPSGYTQLATRIREVGTYDLQLTVWAKRLTAAEGAPSLTVPAAYSGTSGGLSAQIMIVRGVNTTTLEDATAVASDNAAAATWAPTGITTATAGALAISVVASADDNALALSAGSEQGFALRMGGANYDTTTGGDHAVGVASKYIAAAGAVTCPTWNQTAVGNDAWAGITIALRAPTPPASSLLLPQGTFARAPALRRM